MSPHSDNPDPVLRMLHDMRIAVKRLTVATVALYLALAAFGVGSYIDRGHQVSEVRRTTDSTNAALCALRSDLKARAETGSQFLKEHPEGIPGIPPALLQANLASQYKTIAALSPLVCEE